MATPRLVDAFDPEIYSTLVEKQIQYKNALFNSNAVVTNAEFNTLAGSIGTSVIMPYYDELDGTAVAGSRDAAQPGAVDALSMGETKAQKDYLSKSWGVSKLDAQLSGVENVLKADASRTAGFWSRNFDKLLINKVSGVIKDSVANHSNDMVVTVGTDATGAIGDAQKISVNAIIDTQLTMGDHADDLGLWVFPTAVWGTLLKIDAANAVQPSQTQPFATYRGIPVIVTDALVPVQGTNRPMYTSFLLGAGAIQFGSKAGLGGENVIVTDEHAAKNMGSTDLITRQPGLIFHVAGYNSKAAIVGANAGPEIAAYDNATAFERVYDRKYIRIAALKTNG